MRYGKTLCCLLFVLLLGQCSYVDTQLPFNGKPWTTQQFRDYFQLSEEDVLRFVAQGIFNPKDTCTPRVSELPERTLGETSLSDATMPGIEALMQVMSLLHTTIPELYVDTGNTYAFNYTVTADNIDSLLAEARKGTMAALCGQYSQFLNVMWQSRFPDSQYDVRIASMNNSEYTIAHTVNLLYWLEDEVQYGLVADAMYGYVFPMDAYGRPVPLNTLPNAEGLGSFYLAPELLNSKRFLTDHIWPCNLVNPSQFVYHYAPKGALRKYELLMPEDITQLFPVGITRMDYEDSMRRLLQNQSPF